MGRSALFDHKARRPSSRLSSVEGDRRALTRRLLRPLFLSFSLWRRDSGPWRSRRTNRSSNRAPCRSWAFRTAASTAAGPSGQLFPSRFGRSKGDAPHEETAPTVATTAHLPTLSLPLQGGDSGPTVSAQGNALSSRKARRPPTSLSPGEGRKRGVERRQRPMKRAFPSPLPVLLPLEKGLGALAFAPDQSIEQPGTLLVPGLSRCGVSDGAASGGALRESLFERPQGVSFDSRPRR